MRKLLLLLLFAFSISKAWAQEIRAPIVECAYSKLSSNEAVNEFAAKAAEASSYIYLDTVGYSAQKKPVPLISISKDSFLLNKTTVFLFAQQHGNEPSGKEGLLLLLAEIANGKHDQVLDNINILLLPQANPDGGDLDQRRTWQGVDMNRDHLLYDAQETRIIEDVFEQYLPEVTVDIHEYYPYSDSWLDFGYRKDFDIQVGALSNPNVSRDIYCFQKERLIPYLREQTEAAGYRFFEYILGHFPSGERLRHSTTDINDGRQSLGITNSLSFIVEGINGRDSLHNIKRRAESQMLVALEFCRYASQHAEDIKKLVEQQRAELLDAANKSAVVIRQKHFKPDNAALEFPLKKLSTNKDTVFYVSEYHSAVKPLLTIDPPKAYLIPKYNTELLEVLDRNHIKYIDYKITEQDSVLGYRITRIDTSVDEGLQNLYPKVEKGPATIRNEIGYFLIPMNQLRRNKIVIALEPQSMFGLVNTEKFRYLIKQGQMYSILRLE